ncbi:MAG: DUF427 domain-containing protein [Solirubrobacterales bacterium]|nr:DUF427 domain-containing protein [Solirubrobacterales bacterium]
MPRAVWNGRLIAESDDTVIVEGNHYFPLDAVRTEYLTASDKHTICLWKGRASYFSLQVEGDRLEHAAWYYPKPFKLAAGIQGRVAFESGVTVEPQSMRRTC